MNRRIRIRGGGVVVSAVLNETATAEAIWAALPLRARARLWGEEVYFAVPVALELEDGQELVSLGDLGYWPEGNAFCIFFGRTPASHGDEIRPASAVNVFGRVAGDTSPLRRVALGDEVVVERESDDQET
ncbi:MAG: cyclophilin-like fold protein [Chloroflexota bacterium]|nr:cyclophilin-like fold protein [Chloroflexota bacterium]